MLLKKRIKGVRKCRACNGRGSFPPDYYSEGAMTDPPCSKCEGRGWNPSPAAKKEV